MNTARLLGLLGLFILPAVAGAVSFPIVGSGPSAYYNADVAYCVDQFGNPLSSATGVLGPGTGTQQGDPANLIGFGTTNGSDHWSVYGMDTTSKTATATIKLDKTYDLNRIVTQYSSGADGATGSYQLFGSTNGITYTPLISQTNITSTTMVDTFAATNVHYIQWQFWGVGAQPPIYVKVPLALEAFVAASSPDVPQKEQGYDIAQLGSVVSYSGFAGWDNPANKATIDLDFNSSNYNGGQVPASITYDLGATYRPTSVAVDFYGGYWSGGSIQVATTLAGLSDPGATVWSGPGPLVSGTYFLNGHAGEFVRLNGTWVNNSNLVEVGIFLPEPASLSLLALGGLVLLRRRRKT